jgi:hypothetical protein
LFDGDNRFPKLPDQILPHSILDSTGKDLVRAFADSKDECDLSMCSTGCCEDYVKHILSAAMANQKKKKSIEKAISLGKHLNFVFL